jgi:hypothetical protein
MFQDVLLEGDELRTRHFNTGQDEQFDHDRTVIYNTPLLFH